MLIVDASLQDGHGLISIAVSDIATKERLIRYFRESEILFEKIENLSNVRCEGCGYLVSEREHLGCHSEKTLLELKSLRIERDNAEKREYEAIGRANALAGELKATMARLDTSNELLEEEFAQRQDAIADRNEMQELLDDLRITVIAAASIAPHGSAAKELLDEAIEHMAARARKKVDGIGAVT